MISAILNVPSTSQEWSSWTWNHSQDTIEIQQRLRALGVIIPNYQLDPLNFEDVDNWLAREQQSHNDFNAVLGVQGSDLSSVDFQDRRQLEAWIWIDYLEHNTARIALGI